MLSFSALSENCELNQRYYDPSRSSQRDCKNSNKSNDELGQYRVKVSGQKCLPTRSTQSSLNDAPRIPTLRVKGNRNRITKSDDLSSSENVVNILAKKSRTGFELPPAPVQSETIAPPSLDEQTIKDGALAMPHYAASFAASTASRDSQLMMMLFGQELDRKMTQNMQESERRSNATLLQTMAFIANNK